MDEKTKQIYKRLRSIYNNMIRRCYKENVKDYKYYGGKGVKVCRTWKNSFACFCIWALTNGYEENLTLDRVNSNGDYSPENCRWVSWEVQNRNKSQTRNIEINGQVKCLKDWCREFGLNYDTVAMRIHRGMNEKEALGIYE